MENSRLEYNPKSTYVVLHLVRAVGIRFGLHSKKRSTFEIDEILLGSELSN